MYKEIFFSLSFSPVLERYRRAFSLLNNTSGNETKPDCASHGDDSFQERLFLPENLIFSIVIRVTFLLTI